MRFFPLAAILLVCIVSPAAKADTVYTYTGQPFTFINQPHKPGDRVTGSFTMADPLPSNLTDATIEPVAFSFTDGVNTFSSSLLDYYGNPLSGDFLSFFTDAQGNITRYAVFLNYTFSPGDPPSYLEMKNDPLIDGRVEGMGDEAGIELPSIDIASSNFVAGAFTTQEAVPSSVTPEPSSIALLGTGVVGVVGLLRKRLRRH